MEIDGLKARLVAKGYTQIFSLDKSDTFSLVAKIASVIFHWPPYPLNTKNTFLMEIWKMRYIWSNQQVMFLKVSLVTWCVDYNGHFMASSSMIQKT